MENTVKQGKIFIGGISWETTEETLKQHFSLYGEVVKSEIPKVWETGFGKGFGFVTFADSSGFDELLRDQHIILGRTVDVSLARPKGETSQSQRCSECQQTSKSHRKKIFVGGLPHYLSEEDFKRYFERFGRIEDAKIIFDRETNTPRGFGFITYDSEEAVTNVLQRRFHVLNNKFVEVKKAMPKEKRVMDTCTYTSYPTNSGYVLVPVLNTNDIYAPNSSNGVDNGGSYKALSNGAYNSDVENQIDVKCSNGSDCGTDKSVSHEGNHQDCNIEVQLVGNVSPRAPRSMKSLENEADNGEKDNNGKNSQVNKGADHGKKDQSLKNSQVNSVAENGEKYDSVKNSQINTEADNGKKDQSEMNSQVNTEHETLLEMNGVSRCIQHNNLLNEAVTC
ncbi:heterogeneous nuclear ribonucleoprotein 1 [Nicotiana attenuata]|uniref:Heterogeneous nuclear ribonucleoprotein 1 n=1 Tax=Nicotiana attenuata TaxID=49451 RepID=A0A1J6KB42_NICAT|nr:heterogeneous nuclear ribonucleoprotein 1 [Nicotiana attenuata]